MPAPPVPMQSESFVQARPVVPSRTSDVVEASVPPSSKRWKIVPLLGLVPLEAPVPLAMPPAEPLLSKALVAPLLARPWPPAPVEAPLAEPVDAGLDPLPAPLVPAPQSHAPNPEPSVKQLCAP